ncbi:MAG: carbohydrate-binding family 9-like protein [Acidobacteria bacterium]|nr:carbohydrate-binding family 9-like protein [Acidobacteriota bacterium]
MTNTTSLLLLLLVMIVPQAFAQNKPDDTSLIRSNHAQSDFALTADPDAQPWKGIRGVIAERGPTGDLTPGHRTEIRSRWTQNNLYVLFVCPYQELFLKPDTTTTNETNKLWDWDVAEVFIGTDYQNIKHYTEFQVSPRGEWVDLDIDRNPDPPVHDWQWNSGFEVKARIDVKNKIWYGEMRIPMAKIDKRAPKGGLEMRINFYRLQGPPLDRKRIAWQATKSNSYHVPEAFGRLRLEK